MRNLFTIVTLTLLVLFALGLFGCGKSVNINQLPADKLFELGMEQYNKKKYVKSLLHFQAIVYNYPGETVVDTAQYYVGLSYFGSEEYLVAEREFNRLLLNYPSSPFAINSQFMRAVCFFEGTPKHYGLDQTDLLEAIKQFEDFIIDHPESPVVEDARKYLGQARQRLARKTYEAGNVYVNIDHFGPARTYLQKVIDEYTDTEYAARAAFKLAEIDFRLKDYVEAKRRFDNFTTVYTDHEWAPKASQKAEEASFKAGEQAFDAEEFVRAEELLAEFKKQYPESDKLKKADKLLDKIDKMPSTQSDDKTEPKDEG